MTRMIERWFPCAEVSANSDSGWGSGNQERSLFTWFAARPSAQAKAAVICSLLPWPDDEAQRKRLQELVKGAMSGRYENWEELRAEILKANPEGPSVLDPFSGRGIIPLEAARLGIDSFAVEYSPVAFLATQLLTDYPFRDWADEPTLPFVRTQSAIAVSSDRLFNDVEVVLAEVTSRWRETIAEFFPRVNGVAPWGYLWAVTLPCQECGRAFPLVGSYELRKPALRRGKRGKPSWNDAGQSFYIDADAQTGEFAAIVHDGEPRRTPTLANAMGHDGKKLKGKSAVCPFCNHAHPIAMHQRLAGDGLGEDALLVVADLSREDGKSFREPTKEEREAVAHAGEQLAGEAAFNSLLPATPNELIPVGMGATIRAQLYGARTYGDLMCDRQTLSFVRLTKVIDEVASDLLDVGCSQDYVRALTGYVGAQVARSVRYSTRGSWLRPGGSGGGFAGIFLNESTVAFSYDFFEPGMGDGPATWTSLLRGGLTTLRALLSEVQGQPTQATWGTATDIPLPSSFVGAVVTDPPYDAMVYYSDISDVLYVWLKRALHRTWPELSVTVDANGVQDKTNEIVVMNHSTNTSDHRTREHYDRLIAQAFQEMRRVVRDDGVVTIIFGHGEPEVWERLLGAIQQADLVMTGSWPANTESGGQQGKANIETTLTMACRPATAGRPEGRRAAVEAEIKGEIRVRYPDWERWGLAPTDMLMAAAGPAMEVVGRFSKVLDARGEPVDISSFLPLARAAVQEAMAVEIDHHPLETFDARTRFALWWVRLFNRNVTAKSELRWQSLAASLDVADIRDLVPDTDKGCAFVSAGKHKAEITPESAVIDVALALGRSSDQGLQAMGEVLVASGRAADDAYLWAALKFLADRLPESDPDAIAFTRVLRSRSGLGNVVQVMEAAHETASKKQASEDAQLKLM